MKKIKLQLELFQEKKLKKTHGGLPSNAKCKRPFAPNTWLHISNRAEKAAGLFSLRGFANKVEVESIIRNTAKKFFIVIAEIEVMSNHYHLKARAKRIEDLQNFLKLIHSKIAKYVTNAKKGQPKGKFWDGLVFSRLLTSAMEELYLKAHRAWVKCLRRSTA